MVKELEHVYNEASRHGNTWVYVQTNKVIQVCIEDINCS